MIIHIEWKPEAYLECGIWLFMLCHSNHSNSQQCFAKYCLCEAQLNSLFRSLYREQLVFPHLCLPLQTSNPAPLSLSAGLWRVRT